MPYTYDHPRPALTVDCVVFRFAEGRLMMVLIRRKAAPFRGKWALPGGFVNIDEPLEKAALRELKEETGIARPYLEQIGAFGDPKRDPRGRVVSVAYLALVRPDDDDLLAGDDAAEARWFDANQKVALAFDHRKIRDQAKTHLREGVALRDLARRLLPKRFSLTQFQALREVIDGANVDQSSPSGAQAGKPAPQVGQAFQPAQMRKETR